MNKEIINLSGNDYQIIDVIENISVADSFVTSTNKIGEGAGEAKLYLGRNEEQIISFFGDRGFLVNCFLRD